MSQTKMYPTLHAPKTIKCNHV